MEFLIESTSIIIDRKKDSFRTRFNEVTYPVDHGFLEGTYSLDGPEANPWFGSGSSTDGNGCYVSVDLEKGDCLVKKVLGCSEK